jgi:hypothetical protein
MEVKMAGIPVGSECDAGDAGGGSGGMDFGQMEGTVNGFY